MASPTSAAACQVFFFFFFFFGCFGLGFLLFESYFDLKEMQYL